MRLFTRLIVCAAVAMLLSAALFYIADSWFGEDSGLLGTCRRLVLEARRTESLRERLNRIARSRSAKFYIVDQLLAGHMSFRQAIVQFQRANDLVKDDALDLIPPYRTPTDQREVGRQVILYVRNSIASGPSDKTQRLLSDFEREYRLID